LPEPIRRARTADASSILAIAEANRADYQRYQATLWRGAGACREQQVAFLEARLSGEESIAFVHEIDRGVDGFIFASVVPAPPVYNPGGPVALIDDFGAGNPADLTGFGADLLTAARADAMRQGAVLTVVVAGREDEAKRALLVREGFSLASEWHIGGPGRAESDSAEDGGRPAELGDLAVILDLCERRRVQYEAYQPIFWRNAPDGRAKQAPFLDRTLRDAASIALIHERQGSVDGFLIGRLLPAPEVYGPVHPICLIDDYCVAAPTDWRSAGTDLLERAGAIARSRGAESLVVICGHRDEPKRQMLADAGLQVSSEWWVGQ